MIPCVFVYADGKVGLRVEKTTPPVIRVVDMQRLRPIAWVADDMPPCFEPIKTIDYKLAGTMFDGRPVYCDPHFDLKYAYCQGFCQNLDDEILLMDAHNRDRIAHFIRTECPTRIMLDSEAADGPIPEEMPKGVYVCRRFRALMAVPRS